MNKRSQGDGKRREFDLTEPVIVACVFITGGAWEISEGSVRLVGWVELPDLGDLARDKRIVVRCAMTRRTARNVLGELSNALEEGD